MATISNSDQEKNELEVVEVNESAEEMMRKLHLQLAFGTFQTNEITVDRDKLDMDKINYDNGINSTPQGNNSSNASSSTTTSGSSSGGTVTFVDSKAVLYKMPEIRENPAMEIPEGDLNKNTREKIERKAEQSQKGEKEGQARE